MQLIIDFDLAFYRGEVHCLLGETSAGKACFVSFLCFHEVPLVTESRFNCGVPLRWAFFERCNISIHKQFLGSAFEPSWALVVEGSVRSLW